MQLMKNQLIHWVVPLRECKRVLLNSFSLNIPVTYLSGSVRVSLKEPLKS